MKCDPLGNGDFCTNPFYAACRHRMACARCEFHLPAESQVATALVAKEGLQHMLVEMPLNEEECSLDARARHGKRAASQGVAAMLDLSHARKRLGFGI